MAPYVTAGLSFCALSALNKHCGAETLRRNERGQPLHPICEVTAKIGEGGMGEVYRARDTKLDGDVALSLASRRRKAET